MGCPQTLVGAMRSPPRGAEFEGKTRPTFDAKQMASGCCGKSIVCPAPRRPTRTSHSVDTSNKFVRKQKSPVAYSGQSGVEFMFSILSQGELEDDLDNRVGFFRGSPPVRTNNPLVHDLQFASRASLLPTSAAIPLSPTGRKFSSAGKPLKNVDGATSPLSDRSQKPGVRIEGFALDNSDSESREQAPAPQLWVRELLDNHDTVRTILL